MSFHRGKLALRRRAFAQVFGGNEMLLSGVAATSFRPNIGFPLPESPTFNSHLKQSFPPIDKDFAQNNMPGAKTNETFEIFKGRSSIEQYYARLASSAAFMNQLHQNWTFRSLNPYILQKNLSLLSHQKDDLHKQVNISSTGCSRLITKRQKNDFGSIFNAKQAESNWFDETSKSQPDNRRFCSASRTNDCEITSKTLPITSKQVISWYSRFPLSCYTSSSPNPLFSSSYPFSSQSFLNSFPLFQPDLTSSIKM